MDEAPPEVYDLLEGHQDRYAQNLAEVNQRNRVLVTEDIFNTNGVLIARKGTMLDQKMAARVIQHRLAKPLEEQVQLEHTLGAEQLYAAFEALLQRYPDVAQLHQAVDFVPEFKRLVLGYFHHPLVSQKLTVLKDQQPKWFEKAVFCSWLAALLAREIGLDVNGREAAMVAGLAHDVGILHIAPEIVQKPGRYSSAEWRSIQCHVVIGELFLKGLQGLDPLIPQAVLEHHERCDGTGYPVGKMSEQLSVLGNILGMSDSIEAIRSGQFAKSNRNLRDLQPYLQMNDQTHSVPVYRAMRALLKRAGLERTAHCPHENIPRFAEHLLQRSSLLAQTHANLVSLMEGLLDYTSKRRSRNASAALTVVSHVVSKAAAAGITGDNFMEWLRGCARDGQEDALLELNEVELMQNELFWHLNNARRQFEAFAENECAADEMPCSILRAEMEQLSAALDGHARAAEAARAD